jgi:alpha-glutamyl/putrescinyl thymine pyrophosphorylase clade 1
MTTINIEPAIYFITEREQIRRRREAGEPKPWTTDPILRDFSFCNVQREECGELPPEKIRCQCEEYIALLDAIFATPLWHFISGRFAEVTCDCGFLIKRRVEIVNVGSAFECAECGRIYDVVSLEGKIGINLRVAWSTCVDCKSDNEIGAHELEEGKQISCRGCEATRKIGRAWVFS